MNKAEYIYRLSDLVSIVYINDVQISQIFNNKLINFFSLPGAFLFSQSKCTDGSCLLFYLPLELR